MGFNRRALISAGIGAALATAGLALPANAATIESTTNEWSGALYAETNAAAGNAVMAFRRSCSGELTELATYPTGGRGSGAVLGSQGAVTLTPDGRAFRW